MKKLNRMLRIAHRGVHGADRVENSRPAVETALEQKVDGLEVDLQWLGDRSLVLHHDPYLTPTSQRRLEVRTLSLDEFRHHAGWEIMTLNELLTLPWDEDQLLILEIKERRSPADCVRLLSQASLDSCSARVILSTLDPRVFDQLVRLNLEPAAAVVSRGDDWSRTRLNRGGVQWHLRASLLSDSVWRERVRKTDRTVIAWTVNDPSDMERLARLGVDGIMTDNERLLKED